MDLFDKFSKTITITGQGAMQKTKDFADVAKYNAQILDLKNKIERSYKELGEQYYIRYSGNPESDMIPYCEKISAIKAQIDQYEDQINLLKGGVHCSVCGSINPKNMTFCSSCGQRLKSEDMVICAVCGAKITKDAAFCTNCGSAVNSENSEVKL